MILLWILVLPVVGGAVAFFAAGGGTRWAQRALAVAFAADLVLLVWLWGRLSGFADATGEARWIAELSVPWMPQLGVRFALAMDGLSLLLAMLTCVGGLAVTLSMDIAQSRAGLHTLSIALLTAAMLGVFLASDLVLFFICYELMLLPAYGLIAGWGTGDTRRAATRFFMFTQAGGLLMLIAVLGIHVVHYQQTGVQTFLYTELANTNLSPGLAMVFLVAFLAAFAVKLPLVPFHTWQPDAYACAPTEASILFSAVMAKTAGYGILRFAVPMFPGAAERVAPAIMTLGVLTILYASWLAYGQTDLKRIIAYSSAAHLGYIVLGAFAMNDIGNRGAIVQMVCHGMSVTGLFVVAHIVERRTGTRNIEQLGGLWKASPRLGALALVFALATLGLPGLGNFVGEFLILVGTFQHHPVLTVFAALGAVLAAAYSLRIVQRIFFGPLTEIRSIDAPAAFVTYVCAALIGALIWIGLYPQPILDAARIAPVHATSAIASAQAPSDGGPK